VPSQGKRKGTQSSDAADRLRAASSPSGETPKPDAVAPAASKPLNAADLTVAALGDGASGAGDTVIAQKDAGEAGAPSRSIDLPRSFGLSHQGDMRLSSRAAAADSAGELSHVDQTRLLDRVARAIQVAPQRGGVIRLRLNPPELGALQLEVSVQRGTLSARLETETQVARTLLLDNLPQLRERLAEQGIRIEQFDVQVGARDADHSQQQPDHSRQDQQAPRTAGQGGRREAAADTQMASPAVAAVMGPTNLNVVI
jgi:flagellar hook-length control protein FliK